MVDHLAFWILFVPVCVWFSRFVPGWKTALFFTATGLVGSFGVVLEVWCSTHKHTVLAHVQVTRTISPELETLELTLKLGFAIPGPHTNKQKQQFFLIRLLLLHTLTHTNTPTQSYSCGHCGKTTKIGSTTIISLPQRPPPGRAEGTIERRRERTQDWMPRPSMKSSFPKWNACHCSLVRSVSQNEQTKASLLPFFCPMLLLLFALRLWCHLLRLDRCVATVLSGILVDSFAF